MKKTKKKVDFNKAPYKGILAEVAKELNITRSAVSQAVHGYKTIKVVELVNKKIEERNNVISRFNNQYAS